MTENMLKLIVEIQGEVQSWKGKMPEAMHSIHALELLYQLKSFQKSLASEIDEAQEVFIDACQKKDPNFKGMSSDTARVTLQASGSKYVVSDVDLLENKYPFLVKTVKSLDSEAMEKFLKDNGFTLPEHVSLNEDRKVSARFTLL